MKKPSYEELEQRIRELETAHSECKQVIEELQQKEIKHKTLFENILLEVHVWELVFDEHDNIKTWKLVDANPAALKAWNSNLSEIIGKNADDIFPFSHATELFMPVVKKIFTEEKPHIWESYIPDTQQTLQMVSIPVGEYFISSGFDISQFRNTELALQHHVQLLERITNSMFDLVSLADIEGNFTYVNKSHERILGYTASEMLGKNALQFIHPDDLPAITRKLEEVVSGGPITIAQYRYKHKEGHYRWFETAGELLRDENHLPDQIIFSTRDVTNNKQIEEELHNKHEVLRITEALANIGSWEWEVAQDRVHWSDELFRIFRIDPAAGAPCFADQTKLYGDGGMERLKSAVETCVKQGIPYEIELQAIRTDGEIRHCISKGQPQFDEQGKVFRIIGSFQDITERKQFKEKLTSLEKRIQSLLDHSPACHKIIDLDLNLQYMNASGYKMLKLDEDDNLYGKPYPFHFFPESSRRILTEKINEVKKSGHVTSLELPACDSEGNKTWAFHSLIPVKENDDSIDYITIVSVDITEQKHLQERIRQSEKMEAIGRLAGGVAHDFNNMLGVIIGHAGMALEETPPSQPIYERLKKINEAGERSSDLTRQLLMFARQQTISPKVLDLNEAIENMTSMLHPLVGENIELAWRPGKETWPVKVDRSQIDQILANLSVNARDAIADVGKIIIETSNATLDENYCSDHPDCVPGEYVLLKVSDNGQGIDSKTLENIFEPFFTTKEPGSGTGLGLATVYGVVKQNNGLIHVYSKQGQGTTFRIYFPRYRTKSEVMSEQVENTPCEPGHETILVVEDEVVIMKLTKQILGRLGYRVITAKTPGEAIHLAQEHVGTIDLLLTDVIMPEMNGRDLAKRILSIYPNLKRLFMSGYTADIIAHHGVLDEGINFIQKPFSPKQLRFKVRDILDKDEA